MKIWIKNHKKISIAILIIIVLITLFIWAKDSSTYNQNSNYCTRACTYYDYCGGQQLDKYMWCYVGEQQFPTQDSCFKYCMADLYNK